MKKDVVSALVVVAVVGTVVMLQHANRTHTKQTSATHITRETVMLESRDATFFSVYMAEQKPIVLDVRTPEEYVTGHLQGARNIDFRAGDFVEKIQALDKNVPYAIYCRTGNRSGQALETMRSLGFTSVVNLSGGIVAWGTDGGAVCTDTTC